MEKGNRFISNDGAFKQSDARLDETDLAILKEIREGGGIPIRSVEELEALAKRAQAVFEEWLEECRRLMTAEQAKYVRHLRVDLGYSWRAVARTCWLQRWPLWVRWGPPSNQLVGMSLCQVASDYFLEDYMEEPWNQEVHRGRRAASTDQSQEVQLL